VVKPSELTPSSTVMLGELLQEAGVPRGVVNIVLGYGDPVGATLSTHPMVDMVSSPGRPPWASASSRRPAGR
jgi:betaine-aldehyde dehydrogenase